MKYIMRVSMPGETANARIKDPQFAAKMKEALTEVKAEAAYFGTVSGHRGGYVVVDINNAAELPAKAEPFFLWLQAEIDFYPVMTPDDLSKAGPAIESAVKKWGK
jgi:hypothetical protein